MCKFSTITFDMMSMPKEAPWNKRVEEGLVMKSKSKELTEKQVEQILANPQKITIEIQKMEN